MVCCAKACSALLAAVLLSWVRWDRSSTIGLPAAGVGCAILAGCEVHASVLAFVHAAEHEEGSSHTSQAAAGEGGRLGWIRRHGVARWWACTGMGVNVNVSS